MRDITLEEVFETVLYHNCVQDSGRIASELYSTYLEYLETVFPSEFIKAVGDND